MSFSPIKLFLWLNFCAQEIKHLKYYSNPRNRFSIPLSYWGFKRFAVIRGFQIWSQRGVWIIFDPNIGKKSIKIDENWDFDDILSFFDKLGIKYHPNPFLRPYLDSPHQGEHFRPPIWKQDWKFTFWLPMVFSKFYLLCMSKKAVFCGENDIGLLFTFKGTELALKICKKLSLVQNDSP